MLVNKHILLISPEPWDHLFVSKHHYACTLAKAGNHVYFSGPPQKEAHLGETSFPGVFKLSYPPFPRGLRFLPAWLQRLLIRKKFALLEQLAGHAFDIVWSFDNSVFYRFDALPARVLKICHIVDLNQDFQFGAAAATADVCFGVNASIVNKLKQYHSKVFLIGHGYALPERSLPVHLPGKTDRIKVGYGGNLELKYIDWALFREMIDQHGEVDFYFAGGFHPQNPQVKWLRNAGNAYLVGALTADEVASFYQHMDVLLICYQADRYPEQLESTHKMMQYLGSGKVVVTTFTAAYAPLSDEGLLVMSKRNADFVSCFQRVLQDLGGWNDTSLQSRRKQVAGENTYEKKIQMIEKILYG